MGKILKSRLLILVIVSLLFISPVAAMAAPDNPGFFAQAKDFMVNKVGHFFSSLFGGEALSPIVISDNGASVKTASATKTTSKKATTTKKTVAKKATVKKTATKKTSSASTLTDAELKDEIRNEVATFFKITAQVIIEESAKLKTYLKNSSSSTTKVASAKKASSTAAVKNSSSTSTIYLSSSGASTENSVIDYSFLDSILGITSSSDDYNSNSSSNSTTTDSSVASSTDSTTASSTGENIPVASSTSANIATSTEIVSDDPATSTEIIVATSTPASDNATSSVVVATTTQNTATTTTPNHLLISRVYVTGNNDLIELYNPTSADIDLATGNYRLEKTKTALDPAILMRLGNAADGTYPGGTIIKAGGTYLIVRAEADATLKAKAQAIVATKTFTLESDGYTIYLGKDAISGPTDPDIVDYLGYGPSATYYEGSSPAPAISDNQVLQRKIVNGAMQDSDDNGADFSLLSL